MKKLYVKSQVIYVSKYTRKSLWLGLDEESSYDVKPFCTTKLYGNGAGRGGSCRRYPLCVCAAAAAAPAAAPAAIRLFAPPQLPSNTRTLLTSSTLNQQRLIIYVMVHCTAGGVPPTKNQYIKIIEEVEKYIKVYQQDSQEWVAADQIARRIDFASPGGDRDWSGAGKGKTLDEWTKRNGVRILHPRRYAVNDSRIRQIQEWVNAIKPRLAGMSGRGDIPLKFSLTYIGSTIAENRRKYENQGPNLLNKLRHWNRFESSGVTGDWSSIFNEKKLEKRTKKMSQDSLGRRSRSMYD
ncbi:hypothetical protein BTUL_0201g00020 [Botrytis tulipae]|uniref:Uncharacterized protein n=1 Tax=Botrytis tulipae TaxID=87230 RepID=A0A4Z1EDX4_9HELO|nr:hypothetical protein BTUL_0201g00020 [Botrytis tulipae]